MSESNAGVAVTRGVFPPGASVQLWRVSGPEVLRPTEGMMIDTKRVPDDGDLAFKSSVEVGDYLFAYGYVDGRPTQVRLRGLESAGDAPQAPIAAAEGKHADGIRVGDDRPDDPRITNVIDGLPAHTIDEALAQPGGPRLHKGAQDGIAAGDSFGTHTTEFEEADARTEEGGETPDGSLRGEALEQRIDELGLKGLSHATADEKREAVAEAEAELATSEK